MKGLVDMWWEEWGKTVGQHLHKVTVAWILLMQDIVPPSCDCWPSCHKDSKLIRIFGRFRMSRSDTLPPQSVFKRTLYFSKDVPVVTYNIPFVRFSTDSLDTVGIQSGWWEGGLGYLTSVTMTRVNPASAPFSSCCRVKEGAPRPQRSHDVLNCWFLAAAH